MFLFFATEYRFHSLGTFLSDKLQELELPRQFRRNYAYAENILPQK